MSIPVYSFLRNHFDLVWRRCWKRPYEHEGLTYQPYSHIQRLVLDRMLDMAESKGAAVELEQALSLRDYLASRPGARGRIRRLAGEGKFFMLACGEAILDSNQCSMETLARNLASGMDFARRVTGELPVVGGRFDSFGSSAQIPQISRQCGVRWLTGFSYSVPTALYWRGIDGSAVCVAPDNFPGLHQFLDHCYHEPCRACGGTGCAACEGTGILLEANVYPPRAFERPEGEHPFLVHWVQSEEMLPDPDFPDELAAEKNIEPRAGGLNAIAAHLAGEIAGADAPPESEVDPMVEFNPVQTGTFTTRMRVKRAARRAERMFYTAEAACMLAALAGAPCPRGPLRRAWLDLPLLFFHDAITGTHNDPAQRELLDAAAHCESASARAAAGLAASCAPGTAAHVFSLGGPGPQCAALPAAAGDAVDAAGQPVPVFDLVDRDAMRSMRLRALAHGSRCRPPSQRHAVVRPGTAVGFREASAAGDWQKLPVPGQVCTGDFVVDYDAAGLVSIADAATGRMLSGGRDGRPNTLVLEVDEGDPWATRGADRARTVLDAAPNVFLLAARRRGAVTEIIHGGTFEPNSRFGREADASVFGLEWTKTVRMVDGLDHVSFVTEVYWKASNRRIRAVFPGAPGDDSGVYGIPGGYLRRPRYEQADRFLWSPDGDWPALDFFGPAAGGAVLYNKGAVGARIEDGALMISLLRSPAFGHCLERYAQEYPMPYGGIRDGGYHLQEYAMGACRDGGDWPLVAARARAYNEPALLLDAAAKLPDVAAGPLQILAIKPSFRGRGTILRALNCSPAGIVQEISVSGHRLVPCTLLEEEAGDDSVRAGTFPFGPFAMRSFRVIPL